MNVSFTKKQEQVLEELRAEIAKGWDGPPSKRSVNDIVRAKTKSYKKS